MTSTGGDCGRDGVDHVGESENRGGGGMRESITLARKGTNRTLAKYTSNLPPTILMVLYED